MLRSQIETVELNLAFNCCTECASLSLSLSLHSCLADPSSGPWGEWSSCSASCGTGSRSRSRNCGLSECQTQTQDCNTQECPDPLKSM